jgi:AraC family transcriptional regulator of adaptative response/methylated-DNA-[protein]-cysteine methyltransferase
MDASDLPDEETLYRAFVARDPTFEGLFFTGVSTTGIFCRPTCGARKPRREHVVFFPTARAALLAGYRPCRRCRPDEPAGGTPPPLRDLLAALAADPGLRFGDRDLRDRGLDPSGVRRWFRRHHGMTFQAYQRTLRLGAAHRRLRDGATATAVAFDHGWESLSGFADACRRLFGTSPTRVPGPVVTVTRLATPLGPVVAGATDAGVCLLEFVAPGEVEGELRRLGARLDAALVPGRGPHLDRLAAELDGYFAGRVRDFTVPLDLRGTPFQQRVWRGLLTIPYGTTRSYGEQARLLGVPTATRAVARANGDNRIAIVVPCHRVVGADGSLTGYGGGLWRKRWLLDRERRGGGGPQ